jgi:hypothetical protein
MTKTFFIFYLIVYFSGCKNIPQKDIVRFDILNVNEDILKMIAVRCENFERAFDDIVKKKVVVAKDALRKVESKLLTINTISSNNSVDVRTKIIFYYSDSTISTLCFDKFNNAEFDGKRVTINDSLFSFLRSYCN